jgi:mannan endo-1,4-beta-mannosidase
MINYYERITLSFLRIFFFQLIMCAALFSQSFIRVNNTDFYLDGKKYFFNGANAYYCLSRVAVGDTNSIREIFSEMRQNNMNVIRIMGFYDSDDSTNPAVIQYKPGIYNETALKALDYVIYKANEYNVKIIISLVNNWEDFGGMNQYVKWYSSFSGLKTEKPDKDMVIRKFGNPDKHYNYFVAGNLTHDDFYSNGKIKEWYKQYISMILNRKNTYTLLYYKNDPAIFSWELANEPESSDKTGKIIYSWIKEMSAYIKSIDNNHLVATGEEGYDIDISSYSGVNINYNGQAWIFNGLKGISFKSNTEIKDIDYGSAHLYNETWNLNDISGNIWIQDHKRICNFINKPFLLGEYGSRKDKLQTYKKWINSILFSKTNGALVWLIGYDSMPDYDGYTIYYPLDQSIFQVFNEYSLKMNMDITFTANNTEVSLPFPNPCNDQINFLISLNKNESITISVYNIPGEEVTAKEECEYPAGVTYKSINTKSLSNGIYFVQFSFEGKSSYRKFYVVK